VRSIGRDVLAAGHDVPVIAHHGIGKNAHTPRQQLRCHGANGESEWLGSC
jgi:hypothetical protein